MASTLGDAETELIHPNPTSLFNTKHHGCFLCSLTHSQGLENIIDDLHVYQEAIT